MAIVANVIMKGVVLVTVMYFLLCYCYYFIVFVFVVVVGLVGWYSVSS